jgi:outer membrane lipoprotein SlyB
MSPIRRFASALSLVAFMGAGLATLDASAACKECGTVTAVKSVKKQGEGSGVGAVAGGVVGGVIGHQIGSGRGNDIATVAGAAGGAYAGHQIEKNQKSTTSHQVVVTLEDGKTRTFNFGAATSYKVGDKVKIVDNKLVRQ